jgi:hypothetical protein
MKPSSKTTVIILSIVSLMGVVILSVALSARNKVVVAEKRKEGCADSMTIIVIDTYNEHYTCDGPDQKIEIYPAGHNRYDHPMVLVKCVCQSVKR